MTATTEPAGMPIPPRDREYRPFPNEQGRNTRQEIIEIPILVRALDLPKRIRVLEIGCGRGIALIPLARLLEPTVLTGLDIDPEVLLEARLRLERSGVVADLVPGDARALPFPSRSFDVVVDFGTCYHIARAEDALREVARVLAPGGRFVHETPLSQFLSHPVRSFGRTIPWHRAPWFGRPRRALLWSARPVVVGP